MNNFKTFPHKDKKKYDTLYTDFSNFCNQKDTPEFQQRLETLYQLCQLFMTFDMEAMFTSKDSPYYTDHEKYLQARRNEIHNTLTNTQDNPLQTLCKNIISTLDQRDRTPVQSLLEITIGYQEGITLPADLSAYRNNGKNNGVSINLSCNGKPLYHLQRSSYGEREDNNTDIVETLLNELLQYYHDTESTLTQNTLAVTYKIQYNLGDTTINKNNQEKKPLGIHYGELYNTIVHSTIFPLWRLWERDTVESRSQRLHTRQNQARHSLYAKNIDIRNFFLHDILSQEEYNNFIIQDLGGGGSQSIVPLLSKGQQYYCIDTSPNLFLYPYTTGQNNKEFRDSLPELPQSILCSNVLQDITTPQIILSCGFLPCLSEKEQLSLLGTAQKHIKKNPNNISVIEFFNDLQDLGLPDSYLSMDTSQRIHRYSLVYFARNHAYHDEIRSLEKIAENVEYTIKDKEKNSPLTRLLSQSEQLLTDPSVCFYPSTENIAYINHYYQSHRKEILCMIYQSKELIPLYIKSAAQHGYSITEDQCSIQRNDEKNCVSIGFHGDKNGEIIIHESYRNNTNDIQNLLQEAGIDGTIVHHGFSSFIITKATKD